MNTEWSGAYILLSSSLVLLSNILFSLPLDPGHSEVYTNKEKRWYNIHERGKGQAQQHPHLIPICTLAPTVPRTLVCGVGWKAYSSQVKSVDLDSEVKPE
jgi:hypothetical protein